MGVAAFVFVEDFDSGKEEFAQIHGEECKVLGTTECDGTKRALAVFCDCGVIEDVERSSDVR